MSEANTTEEEIIETLKRTDLPTILVEGKDDMNIYRWIEQQLGIGSADVLPCNGRKVLVSIYKKRDSFRHGKLVWLADLDMWLFSPPPSDVNGIIFTNGYSIENDLYAGSEIELLLESSEQKEHLQFLLLVCRWFALEVKKFLDGHSYCISKHINQIIDEKSLVLDISCKQKFSETLFDQIYKDYKLKLRGKTLFQLLARFLCDPKRKSKYSYPNILEMCLKFYPNNHYITDIIQKLSYNLLINSSNVTS